MPCNSGNDIKRAYKFIRHTLITRFGSNRVAIAMSVFLYFLHYIGARPLMYVPYS